MKLIGRNKLKRQVVEITKRRDHRLDRYPSRGSLGEIPIAKRLVRFGLAGRQDAYAVVEATDLLIGATTEPRQIRSGVANFTSTEALSARNQVRLLPMDERRYHVVMNPRSGTILSLGITPEKLEEQFKAQNLDVTVDADDSLPFADRLKKARDSDANIIVAAGGDGTVTALADTLVGTDKTLAILPLGTANLMARDLKLPLDLAAAVTQLKDMEQKRIDVGEVNGKIFMHNVSMGIIPNIAVGREHIRGKSGIGAKVAFARFFLHRLNRARRFAVSITSRDTTSRVERVQALAVANNSYDEGFGQVFSRTRLDTGELGLYLLRRLAPLDLLRLSAKMVFGRWHEDQALAVESVQSVSINTKKTTVSVMIDGEVEIMETPLNFRIRPQALLVLAPVPEPESPEARIVNAVAEATT